MKISWITLKAVLVTCCLAIHFLYIKSPGPSIHHSLLELMQSISLEAMFRQCSLVHAHEYVQPP